MLELGYLCRVRTLTLLMMLLTLTTEAVLVDPVCTELVETSTTLREED